jgi:hypothetical protein
VYDAVGYARRRQADKDQHPRPLLALDQRLLQDLLLDRAGRDPFDNEALSEALLYPREKGG